jgi:hypothetical protein
VPPAGEHLPQQGRHGGLSETRVAVTRQPAQVGRVHRAELPEALVLPPDLGAQLRGGREYRRVLLADHLVGAHVDDPRRCRPRDGRSPGVPDRPARHAGPVQPHRLRGNPDYPGVSVQRHQPVPLQPGLVPHMLTGRGEPPQARPLTLAERREPADRSHPLERHVPASPQRPALPHAVLDGELNLNTGRRASRLRLPS